ncbi:hypothetical protein N7G274_009961 [Stereocaulon virgatum]|uniref:Uncharacterized protein n=1 Tax=Stereocaulon virgatum TaxID=373712 RepID=A0ABR3ZUJ9_9LECA
MIKLIHNLSQSTEFIAALHDLSALSTAERTSLGDRMAKLGQYYKASTELILAARRKRYRIFQRIRVESFQIRVPDTIGTPSNPGSATPLIKALQESNHAFQPLKRFNGSESRASAALIQRLNDTRSGIKVHAEIKLLFYYEIYPKSAKPRIICANKSACYLCDLFLRVHGHFQVPRTFGKLNERWILPDWLDAIPPECFPGLKIAVERFDSILDTQIQRLSQGIGRHPDPMESAIGISAHWSMSSLENPTKGHPIFSTDETVSALRDLKESSISQPSASVLVPTKSLSSEIHPIDEFLRPGMSILRQLFNDERSFNISFHTSFFTLSFNTARYVDNVEVGALWVRVRLLEGESLATARHSGNNLMPLESIQLGEEVVVECAIEDLQAQFYVQWNGQLISIQYK